MKPLVLTLLVIIVFSVVGCGRNVGNDDEPAPTQTEIPATSANPTPEATEEEATVLPTATETTTQAEAPVSNTKALDDMASAKFTAMLEAQIAMPGDRRPGLAPGAVLLVDEAGSRFLDARGAADLSTMRPMRAEDRLEIGSITKMFTAVLLLQLQEEGLLSLDDTLSQWLPEVASALPYGDSMTLRQLASHTAGLANYERDLYPMPAMLNDPAVLQRSYSPDELAAWIVERQAPLFEPGAAGQWSYSSGGYALLGLVLEAATGQSLDELYRARLFEPLGLDSAVVLDAVPAEGQIASGYFGAPDNLVDVTAWNPSGAWAAGSLAMDATDLATFAQAFIGGQLFTDDGTLDEMVDFVSTGQAGGFTGYGLGIAALDANVWGHAGGTPGFAAQLLLWPQNQTVAIYLANSGNANMPPDLFAAKVEEVLQE